MELLFIFNERFINFFDVATNMRSHFTTFRILKIINFFLYDFKEYISKRVVPSMWQGQNQNLMCQHTDNLKCHLSALVKIKLFKFNGESIMIFNILLDISL